MVALDFDPSILDRSPGPNLLSCPTELAPLLGQCELAGAVSQLGSVRLLGYMLSRIRRADDNTSFFGTNLV